MTNFNSKYYGSKNEEMQATINRLKNQKIQMTNLMNQVAANLKGKTKEDYIAFEMDAVNALNAKIASLVTEYRGF